MIGKYLTLSAAILAISGCSAVAPVKSAPEKATQVSWQPHGDKDGFLFSELPIFPKGSAQLTNRAHQYLAYFVNDYTLFLKTSPQHDYHLEIRGNADRCGSEEADMELSKARALAVASALNEHGLDPSRIKVVYWAGHHLSGKSQCDQIGNDRVELLNWELEESARKESGRRDIFDLPSGYRLKKYDLQPDAQ